MSKLLSLILTAGLLVYPFATYAADYGSQSSQNQQVPPVAQPLVREGDFAIKLATQLNLGSPTDEATAEDMLAKAGIVPANGWISDYPVTPEIIGQLNDSIVRTADAAKLPMGSDEAKKELTKLAGEMNLPLPAGPGSETAPGQPSQAGSTINNYYYQQGPPVITYYPPPADYLYLYDWVPFPAVWFGFGFPGFFIFHHFTTVVVRPFHGPHHFGRAIVSDHFFDRSTRRMGHVDHVFRTDRGAIRPHMMLRSGDGRTFGNAREFRHADRGIQPGISSHNRPATPGITPRSTRPTDRGTMRNRMSAQNLGPSSRFPQRSFNTPMNSGRLNAGPGMQQRSFSGSMNTGRPNIGSGTTRSFPGGAWHGSGGGFGGHGGHAGGRR